MKNHNSHCFVRNEIEGVFKEYPVATFVNVTVIRKEGEMVEVFGGWVFIGLGSMFLTLIVH
jgi:hypothetical protein